jgi:hypothetical protein
MPAAAARRRIIAWALAWGREVRVNVRVIPTHTAIEESVDLAHEVFNRVFRKVPERVKGE